MSESVSFKAATKNLIQKAKIPFDEKGFPLFADSFFCWKNSNEVTEKQLVTNGWIKICDVLSELSELEKTHVVVSKEKLRKLLHKLKRLYPLDTSYEELEQVLGVKTKKVVE